MNACVLAQTTADQSARCYQFDMVSEKVRKLPVAAYWRTTAPAHIDCIDETERERLNGVESMDNALTSCCIPSIHPSRQRSDELGVG